MVVVVGTFSHLDTSITGTNRTAVCRSLCLEEVMTRPTTIYAAILAEHGNADEQYPRPLTCDVCCARPRPVLNHPDYPGSYRSVWYVTESDPLPDGWQVIRSENSPYHKMTMCPQCYADRAEGKELEIDY